MLQCESLSDAQFNVALGSREWFNANRGGASVVEQRSVEGGGDEGGCGGDGTKEDCLHGGGEGVNGSSGAAVVMLTVFTGRLAAPLKPGQRLKLSWRLLLTPVRGAGAPPIADFGTRYFHMQRFVSAQEAVQAAQATSARYGGQRIAGAARGGGGGGEAGGPKPWIILHQGNQLIPYINYPFLELQALQSYVAEAHRLGAKVKLYYTVRELSTSAVELWALRALRGEVIIRSKTKAAGHVWLREHLRSALRRSNPAGPRRPLAYAAEA